MGVEGSRVKMDNYLPGFFAPLLNLSPRKDQNDQTSAVDKQALTKRNNKKDDSALKKKKEQSFIKSMMSKAVGAGTLINKKRKIQIEKSSRDTSPSYRHIEGNSF